MIYINQLSIAAIFMALAVGMGAFGAHALKDTLDVYSRGVYEKAVLYHLVHGLALLFVVILSRTNALDVKHGQIIFLLFGFGIIVFSGSLYALAISGQRWLGAITPIGGLAFIVAWLLLAYTASKQAI